METKGASINLPVSSLIPLVRQQFKTTGHHSPQGLPYLTPDQPPTVRCGYFVFTEGLNAILNPTQMQDQEHGDKMVVNSEIIGVTINSGDIGVILPRSSPLTIKLWHKNRKNVKNPKCVFWNTQTNQWDPTGCYLLNFTDEYTTCGCTHLTSFAVLMDVTGVLSSLSIDDRNDLTYVTIAAVCISVTCLILCLVVFTCFRSLRSARITIHRNLCLCLLFGELLFLAGINQTKSKVGCAMVAVLLQYTFTAAFMWMLIEGYQLYLMLVTVFETETSRGLCPFRLTSGNRNRQDGEVLTVEETGVQHMACQRQRHLVDFMAEFQRWWM
ncbi:unnamed protein product [Soboliphyme baturini]|uniref:GPS domain-containing protein n=1 Tax=Soboliphyme baturini TaxID=241478 RepID=A0A183IZE1_9BILA|nr:unnamed protein product [Soboliphyme baturini]